MNRTSIKKTLQEINLNFDLQTIREVEDFLLEQIGDISDNDDKYQIYAAAAIISQLKTLPNVYNTGLSKTGIQIQNIMSHLQKLSKEEFLETIKKLLEKMKTSPQKLKKKVEDVKYSYRFYIKFTATFNDMFQASGLQKCLKNDLCSTLWILYLFIKNSIVESESISDVKNLLIILFRSTFQKFVPRLDVETVSKILVQHLGIIPQISSQTYEKYFLEFHNKLQEVYNIRSNDHFNFQIIAIDQNSLMRFLDDMSTLYEKTYDTLQLVHYIDELSYLELKKTLTPLVIKKNSINCPAITKRLNLYDDIDDEDEDSDSDSDDSMNGSPKTPKKQEIKIDEQLSQKTTKVGYFKPLPSQFISKNRMQIINSTPISLKIQNQQFAKRGIQLGSKLTQQTKNLFQKYQKKSYSQFEKEMMETIQKIIKEFDARCKDFQLRKTQMYAFFMYVLSKIDKYYSTNEDGQEFFKDQQIFQSILCLSTELYNFTLRAIRSEYKSYCDLFNLSLKKAFKPITLIQKSLEQEMSKNLLEQLVNIEKKLVIKEIWQDNTGFQIIYGKNSHQRNDYTDLMAKNYKKIQLHSKQRVKQICKPLKISQKIIPKIINLLIIILKQKYYLLKKNNIDQIILCCIMSCLSINQKEEEQTLQMIFAQYNSAIQMSYNSNQHGLCDNMGNSMGIVQYYNQIFLNEMRQIINNAEQGHQNMDIFLTPVRIQINQNTNNRFKNISSLKQSPLFGKLNPQTTLKKRKSSYLATLLKNSQMKEEKDEDQQQPASPTFGPPLVKKLTFGKQP